MIYISCLTLNEKDEISEMTKMEILLKITPAVSIVRKLTPKMEEKHQNRRSAGAYY